MSKVEIDKDGHITFDLVEDIPEIDEGVYGDFEIPVEMLDSWMEANPNQSVIMFGEYLVSAIKEHLNDD